MAGQKSGVGWAFDPDKQGRRAVAVPRREGQRARRPGVRIRGRSRRRRTSPCPTCWAARRAVCMRSSSRPASAPGTRRPTTPKCGTGRGCNNAILAAITVIPGVVFTGSNDGARARLLDQRRIAAVGVRHQPRSFDTVNGVPAKGASISGPGPSRLPAACSTSTPGTARSADGRETCCWRSVSSKRGKNVRNRVVLSLFVIGCVAGLSADADAVPAPPEADAEPDAHRVRLCRRFVDRAARGRRRPAADERRRDGDQSDLLARWLHDRVHRRIRRQRRRLHRPGRRRRAEAADVAPGAGHRARLVS